MRDIQELMRSLRENGIYAAEDGRITSPEKPCVHNTISQALRSLAETVRETVRERTRERTRQKHIFDMGNDQPVFSLDEPEDLEMEGDFDIDFF